MTTVTALGLMVAQVQQELGERMGGRAATVAINAWDPSTGMAPGGEEWDTAVAELVERYGITTAAGVSYGETRFRMPGGTVSVQTPRGSPNYGGGHPREPVWGRRLRGGGPGDPV